jgi:hypothetical protein
VVRATEDPPRSPPTSRHLLRGRPRGVSSQVPELHKRKIGITPFDCPCITSPLTVPRDQQRCRYAWRSPQLARTDVRRDQQRSGWLDEPDQKAGDFDEPDGRERGGLLVIIGIDMDQRGPRASVHCHSADLCGQLGLHQLGIGTGKRCHAGHHDGWPSELVASRTGGDTDRPTGELGHPVVEPGHAELGRQPGPRRG